MQNTCHRQIMYFKNIVNIYIYKYNPALKVLKIPANAKRLWQPKVAIELTN